MMINRQVRNMRNVATFVTIMENAQIVEKTDKDRKLLIK